MSSILETARQRVSQTLAKIEQAELVTPDVQLTRDYLKRNHQLPFPETLATFERKADIFVQGAKAERNVELATAGWRTFCLKIASSRQSSNNFNMYRRNCIWPCG